MGELLPTWMPFTIPSQIPSTELLPLLPLFLFFQPSHIPSTLHFLSSTTMKRVSKFPGPFYWGNMNSALSVVVPKFRIGMSSFNITFGSVLTTAEHSTSDLDKCYGQDCDERERKIRHGDIRLGVYFDSGIDGKSPGVLIWKWWHWSALFLSKAWNHR